MNIRFSHDPDAPTNREDYVPSNNTKNPPTFINGTHRKAYFMTEDATDNDYNVSFLAAIFMANVAA